MTLLDRGPLRESRGAGLESRLQPARSASERRLRTISTRCYNATLRRLKPGLQTCALVLSLSLLWCASFERSLFAQNERVKLTSKGAWPGYERGPAFDVTVVSNRAYVAMGSHGLVIFDVSNPARPARLGAYVTSRIVTAVRVVGNYAYLIEQAPIYPGLLEIVDVTDPSSPVHVGAYATSDYPQRVQVVGRYAYIADAGGGLQIVDVSAPAKPVRVGVYATNLYAIAVQVAGNYAYVAEPFTALHVIDVMNPCCPVQVGTYGADKRAREVAVLGNYVYLTVQTWTGTDYAGTLETVDVSNPANPVRIAATATTGGADHVQLKGNYAYVVGLRWTGPAYHVGELDVFDVSNPANPVRVGGARIGAYGLSEPTTHAGGLFLSGNYAYVATQGSGWQVIDVSNPAQPVRVSGAEISGSAADVQVVGNYAYVADSSAGLQVLDVSDSNHPTLVGGYAGLGFARHIQVVGNYAYVSAWRATSSNDMAALYIMDLSQPTNPLPVSVFDTDFETWPLSYQVVWGSVEHFQVVGNSVYLPGQIWSGSNYVDLAVLDVNDPAHPALAGVSASHFITAKAVQVVGNYAYVTGSDDGPRDCVGILNVFDVSNPTNLVSVGATIIVAEEGYALRIVGDKAYVGSQLGLTVVDVSDPRNPVPIGAYATAGSGVDIRVVDGYAYLLALAHDLHVVDVSNPVNPTLAGQFDLRTDFDENIALDVVGNHAYVADGVSGLRILEITQLPWLRWVSRLGQKNSLSWNGAPGLKLQRSTTLTKPIWTDVPNSEGQSSMEVPIGSGKEFFRLVGQ